MSWEYSALLYTPLILIREGAGAGQSRDGIRRGVGIRQINLFPDADTLIDRLCHGRVIHS